MEFIFKKKTQCDNPSLCFRNLIKKVKEFLPSLRMGENGHLSISISPNGEHQIFLFLYTEGVHESLFHGELRVGEKRPKYRGKLPEIKDIKKLIH